MNGFYKRVSEALSAVLEKTLAHQCIMFEVTTNNFNEKQRYTQFVAINWMPDLAAASCVASPTASIPKFAELIQ